VIDSKVNLWAGATVAFYNKCFEEFSLCVREDIGTMHEHRVLNNNSLKVLRQMLKFEGLGRIF